MTGETIAYRPGELDAGIVERAAGFIKSGGIIVYPTETLYGLGADAGNARTLRRLSDLKGREGAKPFLVIVDDFERLRPLVAEVSSQAQVLMNAFWPGPLTLVFKASPDVPSDLTAGTGTIGARVPSNDFCRELVRASGRPITSTSANRAGAPPLDSIEKIRNTLSEGIDLFIDAGVRLTGAPSTVVDVSGPTPLLLREGAVRWEQIARTLR